MIIKMKIYFCSMNWEDSLSIFILIAVVVVSGCIQTERNLSNNKGEEEQATSTLFRCDGGGYALEIVNASASQAYILQSGQKPFPEIEVNWKLEDGRTKSRLVEVGKTDVPFKVESGLEGSIESLRVMSSSCVSVGTTYRNSS
jgi:hypothetical protein